MEQNNWYQSYQSQQQPQAPEATAKKQRRGIPVPAMIAMLLVTALLAGAIGAGIVAIITNASARRAELSVSTASTVNEISAVQSGSTAASAQPDAAAVADASVETASSGQSSLSPLLTIGGTEGNLTKAQIVEACAPSVVGINIEYVVSSGYYGYFYYGNGSQSSGQTATGSGSGVIVTSDGYIVTCNHVVEDATKITVILNDESSYEATVVGTDSRYDLAVIKIDATGLTPAVLGDSDLLTVGEDVVAIGNPLGELRGTATAGIVSALNRNVTVEGTAMTLIQHDAAVSPGSSGGGLFNASGSLIGIVNAKASSDDTEGIGFAIPVSDVKVIISDLIEHGYVTGRAYLGVYLSNVTLQSDRGGRWGSYGSATYCVQVSQVVAGGAAEAAGIQAGDLILYVDDTQITDTDTLSSAINCYNAGDTATLTIQRNGQQMQVSVTFGEYAPEE